MAEYKVSDTSLTAVANAIRTKGGTSASLSFPDGFATAIGNIPTGGTQPTLITKSISANGTYDAEDDSADGYSEVTVAVPQPPYVTGTFTPQNSEKGTAKSITIPYTGSGYPIVCEIYPTGGAYKSGTDIYTSTQKKVIVAFSMAKANTSEAPDYTNSNIEKNWGFSRGTYKNSDSDATNLATSTGKNVQTFSPYSGNDSSTSCVRFSSATAMTVFVADTNKYGFLAGTEYTYEIIYSS